MIFIEFSGEPFQVPHWVVKGRARKFHIVELYRWIVGNFDSTGALAYDLFSCPTLFGNEGQHISPQPRSTGKPMPLSLRLRIDEFCLRVLPFRDVGGLRADTEFVETTLLYSHDAFATQMLTATDGLYIHPDLS